ncbi:MAG: TlpA disulfide reductase family protein [Myxococcota bacterium]|jgi:peroxiredoxin|nr:TlpA disulfide reductase family protein [Myxococcota bacterium]
MRYAFGMGITVLLHVYLYTLNLYAQSPSAGHPLQLFNQFGIRTLASPAPVSEFTLPDLNGKAHSLKDYRGQWVLLNFWATWCGACASQIDGLRALENSSASKGLKILAVAVDGTPDALRKYQQRKKMNFTILHDKIGTIAATYKANSIPLNYIIDPQGQIVALVRGAFDWQKTIPLFTQLAATPYDPQSLPTHISPTKDQNIDLDLEPPGLELQGPEVPIKAGDSFELKILVTWSGQLRDYILDPPKLSLPSELENMGMQALASGQQGRQALTYKVTLKANKSGQVLLGPVDLHYRPRIEQNPLSTRHQGISLNVQPRTHMGNTTQYVLLIVGALLAFGMVVMIRRRKKCTRSQSDSKHSDDHLLEQLCENAQRAKMNADAALFLETCILFIDASDKPEILGHNKLEIQHFLEKTRFANQSPNPEVLASIERHMLRHLKQIAVKSND